MIPSQRWLTQQEITGGVIPTKWLIKVIGQFNNPKQHHLHFSPSTSNAVMQVRNDPSIQETLIFCQEPRLILTPCGLSDAQITPLFVAVSLQSFFPVTLNTGRISHLELAYRGWRFRSQLIEACKCLKVINQFRICPRTIRIEYWLVPKQWLDQELIDAIKNRLHLSMPVLIPLSVRVQDIGLVPRVKGWRAWT